MGGLAAHALYPQEAGNIRDIDAADAIGRGVEHHLGAAAIKDRMGIDPPGIAGNPMRREDRNVGKDAFFARLAVDPSEGGGSSRCC